MNSPRKPPGPSSPPKVEVVRRPASAPGTGPTAPTPSPRPVVPTPQRTVSPTPVSRPSDPAAPVTPASGPAPSGRPSYSGGGRPAGRGGPPRGPRTPRPPPTPEQIIALAKKERVPWRIAKGDLEGKMRCHIWRKLHAEEARRFDAAYKLMESHPELELADAFGVVQSGKTPAEFLAKKARGQRKTAIKEARTSLTGDPINGLIQELIDSKVELSIMLGERTFLDALQKSLPVAFVFEKSGRQEKLQVVLLARRVTWEKSVANAERDAKLSKKPTPVPREPDRRPVADPRPFVEHVGKVISVMTRNGIHLRQPLLAVGPFDIVLGTVGDELFIPLHALLAWRPGAEGVSLPQTG